MSTTSANKHSQGEHAGEHEHHVLPLWLYFAVFGALIFLTLATVGVSFLGLPSALSIVAALGVAIIKSGLVVGYFMHLKYDIRLNSLVFFSSIIFLVIFFGLTMADLGSRDALNPDEGTFVRRREEILKAQEKQPKSPLKVAPKHK